MGEVKIKMCEFLKRDLVYIGLDGGVIANYPITLV
jgi:hypothetical protein